MEIVSENPKSLVMFNFIPFSLTGWRIKMKVNNRQQGPNQVYFEFVFDSKSTQQ